MPPTAPYPRSTLKRTLKAHSPGLNVSKNADILLYLDYVLFMQEVMRQASLKSRERGSESVSPSDVNRVAADALRKFKG